MFRSPPPHRHSSGHKGGRSEFEKIQLDLARTIKRLGYDKMPLNDEKWRPLLAFLWGFTEANKQMIMIGDTAQFPGRLYSLMSSDNAIELKKFADKLQEALLKAFPREYIDEAKPVFAVGRMSVLYFENVYTPIAALDGRSH
jgi:hypothetical protein